MVRVGITQEAACWPLCRVRHKGHGYCTFDFFDQCPHRMACAHCSFCVPKASAHAEMLEAKANLLRLRQDIPLTDEELAAVDEGIHAYESLLSRLADVPTPAGPTPRELCPLVQLGTPPAVGGCALDRRKDAVKLPAESTVGGAK